MARILIIDDEANIRMMIRLALQHAGHSVASAADGAEGLEKFADGSEWDLVLVDQRMPGLQGLDVLREILARASETRAIMITAFGTIDLAVEAMKAGATDFLRKPFTAEVLRGAVSAALSRHEREPAAPSESVPTTYAFTTVNGYRIERRSDDGQPSSHDRRYFFTVRDPESQTRGCYVVLSPYAVEQVREHAGRLDPPGDDQFWVALGEEALANHLWQNAAFPDDDVLLVEEITGPQLRWIDAVLASPT
jgi:FixJ family two-component response regulator